jgi:hypothetical protein
VLPDHLLRQAAPGRVAARWLFVMPASGSGSAAEWRPRRRRARRPRPVAGSACRSRSRPASDRSAALSLGARGRRRRGGRATRSPRRSSSNASGSPRATRPAAASRMIRPGGVVGWLAPEAIWITMPTAATTRPATVRLAAGADFLGLLVGLSIRCSFLPFPSCWTLRRGAGRGVTRRWEYAEGLRVGSCSAGAWIRPGGLGVRARPTPAVPAPEPGSRPGYGWPRRTCRGCG